MHGDITRAGEADLFTGKAWIERGLKARGRGAERWPGSCTWLLAVARSRRICPITQNIHEDEMKQRALRTLALCASAGFMGFQSIVWAGVSVTAGALSDVPGESRTTSDSGVGAAQTAASAAFSWGNASGNAANGVLRAAGGSSLPTNDQEYAQGYGSVTLDDTLTFSGTDAFNGLLRVTILGEVFDPGFVGVRGFDSTATGTFGLRAGPSPGATSTANRYMFSDACVQPTCVQGTHFREIVELPFLITNSGRSVFFEAVLQVGGAYGATADFSHSAYIELLGIPAGVSFTSTTGFLSDPTPIPGSGVGEVPEPSVLALALMGLAITVVSAKARRFS